MITKGKLTPHQREVYDRIVRMSRHTGWVNGGFIGSLGACNKLLAKGWIEVSVISGPRGGDHYWYRPIMEEN